MCFVITSICNAALIWEYESPLAVTETITDIGFDREIPAFPSMALGAKEMSPLEVLRLYQVLSSTLHSL